MFKYAAILAILGICSVGAAPHGSKRDDYKMTNDTTVFQYALTLEHLEYAFYSGGLERFDGQDFAAAGFPTWVRGRFKQVQEHEASHVAFLEATIGPDAVKPCTYKFPYTDPKSFVSLAASIEGVGTAAYTGAAHYITAPGAITDAASILATEGRHDAWMMSAALEGAPWSGPYQTPLNPDEVYSIAAQFIESCPSTNAALPVKTFPALTVTPATPKPGDTIKVSVSGSNMYMLYHSGSSILSSDIVNGETTIPKELVGVVYAGVASEKPTGDKPPSSSAMLSGLVILNFGLPASAENNGLLSQH